MTSVSDQVKEIENAFLQELYNLKLEDLEKIVNLNIKYLEKTENIPDDIFNIFEKTNGILKNTDKEVLNQLLASINDNDVDRKDGVVNSGDEYEEEEEPISTNDIEDQIKNSASEALRYRIELEKEKSYAGAYPRKEVGIENPKNACYAISSIQMLYSLPFLRKYYTELKEGTYDNIKYNETTLLKKPDEKNVFYKDIINARTDLSGITNFFNLMNNANENILIPSGNCILITNDTQNQQDVSEYFTSMRPIYIYNDATRILTYAELTCQNGKKVKVPEERNDELLLFQIEIKGDNLNSCIESFNNNNNNETFERCKKNDDNNDKVTNANRFYIIPPENRYLFIQLKRFDSSLNKLDNVVEPSKTLIIGGVKYTLSGVIVHSGTTISVGHYVFIQCNKNGDFNKIYNDSNVSQFDENQQYNTDFIKKNGYMFAYTRYPVDQSNVAKKNQ